MIELADYNNPFDAIIDFEHSLSEYTGSKYVVATDSCSHAIELCFRYLQLQNSIDIVTIPNRTYLSIPMIFHILGIPYNIVNEDWHGEYNFGFSNVWDSARLLQRDMYRKGQMQCLSFGHTKPLEIGRGGAILLDDKDTYNWLKLAVYDGRDLSISPWEKQETFNVGYHYRIIPEECITGLNKLKNNLISPSGGYKYPDISKLIFNQ